MGAPVRHRVLDPRVLLELRDRLADRVAVLDRELLRAARQLRHGLRAGLAGHTRRDPAAHALRVLDDHLPGHVVGRARARGGEQQHQEGGDQEEEAYRHWVTVGFGVYEGTNKLPVRKL